MAVSPMLSSARKRITSARISCHITASVALALPSARSRPSMPTTLIPKARARRSASLQRSTRSKR
eukprot:2089105-Pleurochrysis_carterae.AAC.3